MAEPQASSKQQKPAAASPARDDLLSKAEGETAAPGAPVEEQVTYTPGKEDLPTTMWGGVKFTANVPVTIKGHSGDPKKGECKPHERANYELIEKARRNKYFRVGAFDPQKDSVPVRETGKLPETPDQYRAHAIEWAKQIASTTGSTIGQFNAKWEDEEGLRIKCGVGTDDLELLNSVIGPLRAELQRRSGFPQ